MKQYLQSHALKATAVACVSIALLTGCNSTTSSQSAGSELLTDSISVVLNRVESQDGTDITGWASNPSYSGAAQQLLPEEGGVGVTFPDARIGESGTIALGINADSQAKDISAYVEQGQLSLDVTVVSFGYGNPEETLRTLSVSMASQNANFISEPYPVDGLVEDVTTTVDIPLRQFFEDEQGNLNNEAIQSIDQAIVIKPELEHTGDSLEGVEFIINDIYISKTPRPNNSMLTDKS